MCGSHAKHFKAVLSCSLRGRQVGRVGRDRTARAVRGPAPPATAGPVSVPAKLFSVGYE
jgi:hypothetical protein